MTTPKQLAAQAARLLAGAGSSQFVAQSRTYFKPHEKVRFHGVAAPEVRRLARELHRDLNPPWGVAEAIEFCDLMLRRPFMEEKTLGILVLSRYQERLPDGLFGRVHMWFSGMHCDNWAATDALCGEVLGPLLIQHPSRVPAIRTWARSKNVWLRRSSLVALIPPVRKGRCLNEAYATVRILLGDPENLIHKACGWLLREAGKIDAGRLEAFLLENGERIPRTALRYAIERFPEPRRKRILAATRRPRR